MLEGRSTLPGFTWRRPAGRPGEIRLALAALRLTPRLARVVYRVAPTFAAFL
jgi:hypothetical protein